MLEDYLSVPIGIKKRIQDELFRYQCSLVLVCRASNHEEDNYLYLVLAKNKRASLGYTSYVVWYFNSSHGGLNSGSYDLTLKEAFKIMSAKLD